jgi:hypothetical protein
MLSGFGTATPTTRSNGQGPSMLSLLSTSSSISLFAAWVVSFTRARFSLCLKGGNCACYCCRCSFTLNRPKLCSCRVMVVCIGTSVTGTAKSGRNSRSATFPPSHPFALIANIFYISALTSEPLLFPTSGSLFLMRCDLPRNRRCAIAID